MEINKDETERVLSVVAAVDVAKATGMVCLRRPHPTFEERRTSRVWEVASTTNSILALGADLVAAGVQRVVLESTSDYWRPFFYLLEATGLTVWLVNARDVKQVTGRPKTDKLDAVWLAKLCERGMLRPSFVPPREIRVLRDYTRLRTELRRGTLAAQAAPRETARRRIDQVVVGGHGPARGLGPGHDRSAHRRPTPPEGSRRFGLREAQRQTGRAARSTQRPIR